MDTVRAHYYPVRSAHLDEESFSPRIREASEGVSYRPMLLGELVDLHLPLGLALGDAGTVDADRQRGPPELAKQPGSRRAQQLLGLDPLGLAGAAVELRDPEVGDGQLLQEHDL